MGPGDSQGPENGERFNRAWIWSEFQFLRVGFEVDLASVIGCQSSGSLTQCLADKLE